MTNDQPEATVLDGTPYLVCEKGSIRCLWIEDGQAILKTVPENFCGPLFVSKESGESKIEKLLKALPGFQFELIRREDLPFTLEIYNSGGKKIRVRTQIKGVA